MKSTTLFLGLLFMMIGFASLVFLRPEETKTADAIITGKVFQKSTTYQQSQAGPNRGLQTPTSIPIAESYLFFLKLVTPEETARIALNTLASREFEVGQKVRIQYQTRGIPFVWRRIYVTSMHAE